MLCKKQCEHAKLYWYSTRSNSKRTLQTIFDLSQTHQIIHHSAKFRIQMRANAPNAVCTLFGLDSAGLQKIRNGENFEKLKSHSMCDKNINRCLPKN